MSDDYTPDELNQDLPQLPDWLSEPGLPDFPSLPESLFSEPPEFVEAPARASAPVAVESEPVASMPAEATQQYAQLPPEPILPSWPANDNKDPLPAITPPPRSFGTKVETPATTPATVIEHEVVRRSISADVKVLADNKLSIQTIIEPPHGESWSQVRVVFLVPKGVRSAEVTNKPKVSKGRVEWTIGDLEFGSPIPLQVRIPQVPATAKYSETPPSFELSYVPVDCPELAIMLAGPNRVQANASFPVAITVENHGRGLARDVTLAVTRNDLPSEQRIYSVGDLASGEEAIAKLKWSAPATDGPAQWTVRTTTGTFTTIHTFLAEVYTPIALSASGQNKLELDESGRFDFTILNPSGLARRSIDLVISIPPQLEYDTSDGEYDSVNSQLIWKISELEGGEERTCSAWLRGILPGPISLKATATTSDETITAISSCICELIHREESSTLFATIAKYAGKSAEHDENVIEAVSVGDRHLLFRIGGGIYASRLTQLREVIRQPATSSVPDTPDWLLGLANVRGDVTSIIDLPLVFGLESESIGARPVLMAETEDGQTSVGLLVDEVIGIRRMVVSNWVPDQTQDWGRMGEFLSGLSEYQKQLVPVLNLDRVLCSDMLSVFETA
jgi:purine-binding chemotaxis protein CheW